MRKTLFFEVQQNKSGICESDYTFPFPNSLREVHSTRNQQTTRNWLTKFQDGRKSDGET